MSSTEFYDSSTEMRAFQHQLFSYFTTIGDTVDHILRLRQGISFLSFFNSLYVYYTLILAICQEVFYL